MTEHDAHELRWFKARASEHANGCVEVAERDRSILVRDSKRVGGPVLAFPQEHWHQLVRRTVT